MAEASISYDGEKVDYTNDAAITGGEVIQLPDSRAAVFPVDVDSGVKGGGQVRGIFKMTKTSGFVALSGGRAYWDHSANAVYYKKVNDRDFYLGRFVVDAASTDTDCYVALNVDPPYDIDCLKDGALSVATGTAAAGGFGLPALYGGSRGLSLTATNEAQAVDMLSVDRFAVGANAIAEIIFRLGANGSTNAVDISLGIGNGTSTTDADAVTEHVLFHIDGGALDILAQSKDGTTTVTATDTTVDATAGSAVANRFELWIDARDPAGVVLYINGSRVLSGTTFVLTNATGPLGLLIHVEKTSSTATAGPVYIDAARVRLAQK